MRLVRIVSIALVVALSGRSDAQMSSGPTATRAEKIRDAMSAGPGQITAAARILDWPMVKGGSPVELRAGTNGWVCYPRSRADIDNAMCFDPAFQEWLDAYRAKRPPKISGIGVAYLMAGGYIGSAADPFASGKTAANDWGTDGPSLMILAPDPALYAGLPTKRSDGPYVMFAGTPYAHIMVPVGTRK